MPGAVASESERAMTINYQESTHTIQVHNLCASCLQDNCYCDEHYQQLKDDEMREIADDVRGELFYDCD